MNNSYFIGIDGGATKTIAVLVDETGYVVNMITGSAINPNDIKIEVAQQRFKELVEALVKDFTSEITGFYAGIAGVRSGEYIDDFLKVLHKFKVHIKNYCIDSDAINAMYSGLIDEDGMILIAGTGSVVFTKINKKISQIGGYGYLIGDEGSGYSLGRNAFNHLLKSLDGRVVLSSDILLREFEEKLNKPIIKSVKEIYMKQKSFIASFSKQVVNSAIKGDEDAINMVKQCVNSLYELVICAYKKFENEKVTIVLTGGLFKEELLIKQALIDKLDTNKFRVIIPSLPPVFGSVVKSMHLSDKKMTENFNHNFINSYKKKKGK